MITWICTRTMSSVMRVRRMPLAMTLGICETSLRPLDLPLMWTYPLLDSVLMSTIAL